MTTKKQTRNSGGRRSRMGTALSCSGRTVHSGRHWNLAGTGLDQIQYQAPQPIPAWRGSIAAARSFCSKFLFFSASPTVMGTPEDGFLE
jgi:hypothetical protein